MVLLYTAAVMYGFDMVEHGINLSIWNHTFDILQKYDNVKCGVDKNMKKAYFEQV